MPAEAPAVSADEIAEPGETPKPDATRKKRSRRKKTKTVALLMLGATGIGSLLGGCSHNKQPDDGSATERGAAQRVKTNWQVQAVPQPETENKGEQSDVRNQPLFAPGSLDDIKLSEYTYPGTSLPKLSTEKPLSRDEIEKLWIDGASREDFSGSVRKQHLCLMTQDDLVRTFARVITRLFEAAETGNEGKIETLRRDLRACVQEAKARGMLQAGRDGVWRKMRTMVQEGELDVGDKVLGATAAVTGLQNAYVTDRQNPGYSVK